MKSTITTKILCGILGLALAGVAQAAPFSILIGDNDGYGAGIADNASAASVWTAPPVDNRSLAESTASNGAQITDAYDALGYGPVLATIASVKFTLAGFVTAATLTIDMGDFQSSTFGAFAVTFAGIAQPFSFDDGYQATAVRSWVLTAAQLAAANSAGYFEIVLNRSGSADYVAFDYFKLEGDAVPDGGSTVALMGLALLSVVALRRKLAA